MLTLSQRDRDRLAVLRQVEDGLVSSARGAELVALSARQFRRLRRRQESDGDRAVIHGLPGWRSNRAASPLLRAHVMERAQEQVFRDFGPTLLAEHLSRDPEIRELNACTLRLWMIEAGLWKRPDAGEPDIARRGCGGPRAVSSSSGTAPNTLGSRTARQVVRC